MLIQWVHFRDLRFGGEHKSSKYVQYVLVKIALKVERTMNVLRSQTYMARTGTCTYLGLFSWHACTYLGLFSWPVHACTYLGMCTFLSFICRNARTNVPLSTARTSSPFVYPRIIRQILKASKCISKSKLTTHMF